MDPIAAIAEIEQIERRECSHEGDAERLEELREALAHWQRIGGFAADSR